jgi:DNA-binding response OmpR family regulator
LAKIGILIIENDEVSQSALRQLLDAEGWRVHIVPAAENALPELATGEWSLVIANAAMIGLSGQVYSILRELALSPAVEDDKTRARVLFIVPEAAAAQIQPVLEHERLPYVLKPFQFQDLLEKVSDLLMENSTLSEPIRRVRHDATAGERRRQAARVGYESGSRPVRRETRMFARRDEYMMTEEEMAEYEKAEQETQEQKKKKKKEEGR